MLIWNRWNQELTGRIYFNIYKNKTRSHARHAARSPALVTTWMDQSETLLLFFVEIVWRKPCSRVPQSSSSLVVMRRRVLGSRMVLRLLFEFWECILIFAWATLSVTSPCFGSWSQSNAVLSSVCWMGVGAGTRALLESSCACLVAARPRAPICVSTVNTQNWEQIDSTESIDGYNVDKKNFSKHYKIRSDYTKINRFWGQ